MKGFETHFASVTQLLAGGARGASQPSRHSRQLSLTEGPNMHARQTGSPQKEKRTPNDADDTGPGQPHQYDGRSICSPFGVPLLPLKSRYFSTRASPGACLPRPSRRFWAMGTTPTGAGDLRFLCVMLLLRCNNGPPGLPGSRTWALQAQNLSTSPRPSNTLAKVGGYIVDHYIALYNIDPYRALVRYLHNPI